MRYRLRTLLIVSAIAGFAVGRVTALNTRR
jgi:hypothetical protein